MRFYPPPSQHAHFTPSIYTRYTDLSYLEHHVAFALRKLHGDHQGHEFFFFFFLSKVEIMNGIFPLHCFNSFIYFFSLSFFFFFLAKIFGILSVCLQVLLLFLANLGIADLKGFTYNHLYYHFHICCRRNVGKDSCFYYCDYHHYRYCYFC